MGKLLVKFDDYFNVAMDPKKNEKKSNNKNQIQFAENSTMPTSSKIKNS